MKKLLSVLIMAVMFVPLVQAQAEYKSDQKEGYIIDSKGNKTEGVIEINGSDSSPWANQAKVNYIPKEAFKQTKVKRKDKTAYKPGKIKEFKFGDRYFESVKFSDMSAAGTGMIPKWYFLERLCEGKIKIYLYYETPMMVGESSAVEASRKRCLEEYQVVIQKDDLKPKSITNIDIKEYIGDNQEVLDKYLAGEYGLKPLDNGEKKGLSKFASRVIDANLLEGQILEIVNDYNK